MSAAGSKLRLGPLPRTETVKLTIAVSVELKAMLDRYADLHGQAWGEPVDAVTLIPHMLAAFVERDRGFRAAELGGRASKVGARASPAAPGGETVPSGDGNCGSGSILSEK